MKNPFIAGSWVRGNNFFGREPVIREILDGDRNSLWVAGTRRLGKTSLLKQIELLASEGDYSTRFVPLFWDMQGSQNLAGLKESLLESIEDAEERFEAIGVDILKLEQQDVFGILRSVRRHARERDLSLLLLCDEAEELINVEQNNPQSLPKLRRTLQRGENLVTVLTATRRLSRLESSSSPNTSPFLFGFVPPVYLTPLAPSQACQLIRLGGFPESIVQEVVEKANNHPYLIQLIGRRLFDVNDLRVVIDEICADDMVAHFFSVDFHCLEPGEKEILLFILQKEGLGLAQLQRHFGDRLVQHLYELVQLGFVVKREGRYEIGNFFFRQWLAREKQRLFTESVLKRADESASSGGFNVVAQFPEPGQTLGHHEIEEKLGSGGMGIVFKARDTQLNRTVALKLPSTQTLADDDSKQRFLQEARAASAMNHPNIATVYQVGEHAGLVYISMEYVRGDDLRTWRDLHPDDLGGQLSLAIQAGEALAHAHSRNVVHRDVKSENILVTNDRAVKVMDFGLAKPLAKAGQANLTKSGTTLGTLSYMSPEQASGLETDHRTDIFSFGVVLYELFTGVLPFTGEYELSVLYAILNEEPAPVQELAPALPEALALAVAKACQKDMAQRYQSMDDFVAELKKVASEGMPIAGDHGP